MNELRRQLEYISALGEEEGFRGVGSLERFVLKHGHEFSGAIEIPKHVTRGEMKLCFGNAAMVALTFSEEFIYTEGYAWKENIPMPFAHAWVINRQGQVIDPTWGNDNRVDYFGVLVRHDYVRLKAGLSVLDDYQNGWHLIQSKAPEKHLVTLEKWISNPGLGVDSSSEILNQHG